MSYSDPENPPSWLNNPFTCEDCEWEGTWEDCDYYEQAGYMGLACPHCGHFTWWQMT